MLWWEKITNYGPDPMPPRFFVRDEEPQEEPEDERPAGGSTKEFGWKQCMVVVMRALNPFPEAKQAVIAAFHALDAENSS